MDFRAKERPVQAGEVPAHKAEEKAFLAAPREAVRSVERPAVGKLQEKGRLFEQRSLVADPISGGIIWALVSLAMAVFNYHLGNNNLRAMWANFFWVNVCVWSLQRYVMA